MSAATFALALEQALAGRTAAEVARRLGCSQTALSRWRSGAGVPALATADRLADLLEAPAVRMAAARHWRRRCSWCRAQYTTNPRTASSSRYCRRTCRAMASRHRGRQQVRQANGKALAAALRAVAAMCRACEPQGVCRDSGCPLRPVSPLPYLGGSPSRPPVTSRAAPMSTNSPRAMAPTRPAVVASSTSRS